MIDDRKQCETCPWPLDCYTEDGELRTKPVAVDCPRDHSVWERRLGEVRLDVITGTRIAQVVELDDEDVVLA